jgi:dimethylargininase
MPRLMAITRRPSPRLADCRLEFLDRRPIDFDKAAAQHAAYEESLRSLGAEVISLAPEPDLPDAVFVEDPAVVLDDLAIVTRMGAESRRGEEDSIAAALEPYRAVRRLREPATLEGGDVMRVGSTLYVGLSVRTNPAGIRQLRDLASPLGYAVQAVSVRGCMHLKTGCCYAGSGTVLANRAWVESAALEGLRILDVPASEPWGADVLVIGDTVVLPDSFPETARLLEREGFRVRPIDVSELQKAEAGVTCMSLLFDTSAPAAKRL